MIEGRDDAGAFVLVEPGTVQKVGARDGAAANGPCANLSHAGSRLDALGCCAGRPATSRRSARDPRQRNHRIADRRVFLGSAGE